jgi:hypothetical protein
MNLQESLTEAQNLPPTSILSMVSFLYRMFRWLCHRICGPVVVGMRQIHREDTMHPNTRIVHEGQRPDEERRVLVISRSVSPHHVLPSLQAQASFRADRIGTFLAVEIAAGAGIINTLSLLVWSWAGSQDRAHGL